MTTNIMLNKQIKNKIRGPVFPIVTPFVYKNNSCLIDYISLKRYIDFLITNGAKVIMVASATSRFAQLTVKEIIRLNREVVNHVGERALVVTSTPILGSTKEHIEVAKLAEKDGAKVIACEYPWRYQDSSGYINYFKTIIKSTKGIKIFLHVTPVRSELGGWFRGDVDALVKIVSLDRVVGVKEASGEFELSKKMWLSLSSKTKIIVAGRASETFYKARLIEPKIAGYFVGTGNINPASSINIFSLIDNNDFKKAKALISKFELPFLDLAKQFGWHASLKCGLSHLNLMSMLERPPMVSVNKSQSKQLKKVMTDVGWLRK